MNGKREMNNMPEEKQKCVYCTREWYGFVKTSYGPICSKECFKTLCNEILNANTEDFEEDAVVIDYDVPINNEEDCKRINESLGTNFRSTEEHMLELLHEIYEAIGQVGDKGGWYIGDGIKVRAVVEYEPEDK